MARIADLLLNPGQSYQFNGEELVYPAIKLVYWTGGNPFHHHQDLNQLLKAWRQPETIIVHEPFWTATARYADIVLPATTPLERNDINFTFADATMTPMQQAVSPFGQARNDHAIFAELADRLGFCEAFTEGRDETMWLRHFYEEARTRASKKGRTLPDFESFWLGGPMFIESDGERRQSRLERFRQDPDGAPLRTPSGKIEIFSETIAGFRYNDCPGHPVWLSPSEWLGAPKAEQYPLHLLSNQPKTRLHSQLDSGRTSRNGKIDGREVARMNPLDAQERGVQDGDWIKLYNDRGSCLAIVKLSDDLRSGVVQLPTGAWFNPLDLTQDKGLEIHGNPNVLTKDIGTSQLGQGPSAHTTLIEVEKYDGPKHPVRAFAPPQVVERDALEQ